MIEFLHTTIQEYLVAEHLVEKIIQSINSNDGIEFNDIMLKVLNDTFSGTKVFGEISNFFTEITSSKDSKLKKEINQEIIKCLPYFIEKDFIHPHFYERNPVSPLKLSNDTFHGFKLLMDGLGFKTNDIEDFELRERFNGYYYLKYVI